MVLSADTPLIISLGTVIGAVIFVWRLSRNISQFKGNISDRLNVVESSLSDHEKMDKENNLSERLARIETDIQWIRQSLDKK